MTRDESDPRGTLAGAVAFTPATGLIAAGRNRGAGIASRDLRWRQGMVYTLYYTDVDGIRSQAFASLREVQTNYGALPRRLRPAWVCDDDGNVILGIRPEPPD